MKNKRVCRYNMHIKCGDVIKIIAGREKGKIGVIKSLLQKESKVIIEKINLKTKYIKRKRKGENGRMYQIESPIHSSNIIKWDE